MRILIALFILLFSSNATALSCIHQRLEERYRDYRHVALVEVVGAQIEESEGFPKSVSFEQDHSIKVETKRRDPAWRRIVATIRVLQSFKGTSPPAKIVVTSWGSHPEIAVGAAYLVFLNGSDASLDCGGMSLVSPANPKDTRTIGALRALAASSPD